MRRLKLGRTLSPSQCTAASEAIGPRAWTAVLGRLAGADDDDDEEALRALLLTHALGATDLLHSCLEEVASAHPEEALVAAAGGGQCIAGTSGKFCIEAILSLLPPDAQERLSALAEAEVGLSDAPLRSRPPDAAGSSHQVGRESTALARLASIGAKETLEWVERWLKEHGAPGQALPMESMECKTSATAAKNRRESRRQQFLRHRCTATNGTGIGSECSTLFVHDWAMSDEAAAFSPELYWGAQCPGTDRAGVKGTAASAYQHRQPQGCEFSHSRSGTAHVTWLTDFLTDLEKQSRHRGLSPADKEMEPSQLKTFPTMSKLTLGEMRVQKASSISEAAARAKRRAVEHRRKLAQAKAEEAEESYSSRFGRRDARLARLALAEDAGPNSRARPPPRQASPPR
eukprot:gnl/TRDRNA2_/TRDRNA2_42806_c1_seq1.p1 gnl/TRDRNA2_/TRDRNA2_42806_c1~~gnl/TRDRNA2_/TRDRNA2_42806_c1_seq1.p1  ORF type:complete len:402 (+),score=72.81 gnl/TRDRNA2_/TRDRNA2_42806_c1_seq1:2-1207(+)